MKKVIRLTESELNRLVKRIINERRMDSYEDPGFNEFDSYDYEADRRVSEFDKEIVNVDEVNSFVKQYETKLEKIIDEIYTKNFDKLSNKKLNKLITLGGNVDYEYRKLYDRIFNEMKNKPKKDLWAELDKIKPLFHLNNQIDTYIYELKDYFR